MADWKFIFQRLLLREAEDADCGLVGTALADLVGEEHTVAGDIGETHGCVGVAAEGGGIDEALIFRSRRRTFRRGACPAVAHVDRSLLFASEALHEVVVAGTLNGDRPARGMLKRVEIVDGLVTDGVLLQIARGVGVLLVDEGAGFRAFGIFEPAIIISDFCAEVVVDYGIRFRQRGRGECDAVTAVDGLSQKLGTKQNDEDKTSDAPHQEPPARQDTRAQRLNVRAHFVAGQRRFVR